MNTVKARFIGTQSNIGQLALRYFGQQCELRPDQFRDAVLGNCALISEDDFEACGFTPEEMKSYARPVNRRGAGGDFNRKLAAARKALFESREILSGRRKAPLAIKAESKTQEKHNA